MGDIPISCTGVYRWNLRILKLSKRDNKSLNKLSITEKEKSLSYFVDIQPGKFYKIYEQNKVKMNQLSKDF